MAPSCPTHGVIPAKAGISVRRRCHGAPAPGPHSTPPTGSPRRRPGPIPGALPAPGAQDGPPAGPRPAPGDTVEMDTSADAHKPQQTQQHSPPNTRLIRPPSDPCYGAPIHLARDGSATNAAGWTAGRAGFRDLSGRDWVWFFGAHGPTARKPGAPRRLASPILFPPRRKSPRGPFHQQPRRDASRPEPNRWLSRYLTD